MGVEEQEWGAALGLKELAAQALCNKLVTGSRLDMIRDLLAILPHDDELRAELAEIDTAARAEPSRLRLDHTDVVLWWEQPFARERREPVWILPTLEQLAAQIGAGVANVSQTVFADTDTVLAVYRSVDERQRKALMWKAHHHRVHPRYMSQTLRAAFPEFGEEIREAARRHLEPGQAERFADLFLEYTGSRDDEIPDGVRTELVGLAVAFQSAVAGDVGCADAPGVYFTDWRTGTVDPVAGIAESCKRLYDDDVCLAHLEHAAILGARDLPEAAFEPQRIRQLVELVRRSEDGRSLVVDKLVRAVRPSVFKPPRSPERLAELVTVTEAVFPHLDAKSRTEVLAVLALERHRMTEPGRARLDDLAKVQRAASGVPLAVNDMAWAGRDDDVSHISWDGAVGKIGGVPEVMAWAARTGRVDVSARIEQQFVEYCGTRFAGRKSEPGKLPGHIEAYPVTVPLMHQLLDRYCSVEQPNLTGTSLLCSLLRRAAYDPGLVARALRVVPEGVQSVVVDAAIGNGVVPDAVVRIADPEVAARALEAGWGHLVAAPSPHLQHLTAAARAMSMKPGTKTPRTMREVMALVSNTTFPAAEEQVANVLSAPVTAPGPDGVARSYDVTLIPDTGSLRANARHMGNCTYSVYRERLAAGSGVMLAISELVEPRPPARWNAWVACNEHGWRLGEVNSRFNTGDVPGDIIEELRRRVAVLNTQVATRPAA